MEVVEEWIEEELLGGNSELYSVLACSYDHGPKSTHKTQRTRHKNETRLKKCAALQSLDILCRLCLKSEQVLIHLENSNLLKILENILQVKVEEMEDFPLMGCCSCVEKLKMFEEFKVQCENAQRGFQAIIRHTRLNRSKKREANTMDPVSKQSDDTLNDLAMILNVGKESTDTEEVEKILKENADDSYANETGEDLYEDYEKLDSSDGWDDETENDIVASPEGIKTEANVSIKIEVSDIDVQMVHNELFNDIKIEENNDNSNYKEFEVESVTVNQLGAEKAKDVKPPKAEKLPADNEESNISWKQRIKRGSWEKIIMKEDEVFRLIDSEREKNLGPGEKVRCLLCVKNFKTQQDFDAHEHHHSHVRGPYECQFCKYRFESPSKLKTHMAHHYVRYRCKRCDRYFANINAAISHEKSHNTGVHYSCLCGKVFKQLGAYKSHLDFKHPSSFACPGCGHSFRSLSAAQLHFRIEHPASAWPARGAADADGALYCGACSLQFMDDAAFETHVRTSAYHGVASRVKLKDDAGLKGSAVELRVKASKADGIRTNCHVCGASFPSAKAYRAHHRALHPATPPRGRLMCEQCGALFHDRHNLEMHQSRHTGAKPYQCDECSKVYRIRNNLIAHIKTAHEGVDLSVCCPECGKTFSKGNLNAHVMHVHQGIPRPPRTRKPPRTGKPPRHGKPPRRKGKSNLQALCTDMAKS